MTRIVAIVNVTPDSFSGDGRLDALAHIDALAADGADVLDIGAESTRPGATPLSAADEWQRLAPVLAHALKTGLPVSIDTRHAETARRALAAGAHWINNVSGFADEAMLAAVAQTDCKLVAMHSLSVPPSREVVLPAGCDVIAEIVAWAAALCGRLALHGIDERRVILDPGIGFGKTAEQSWKIINRVDELKALGLPILIGHSRKSFLGSPKPAADRDPETLAVSRQLIAKGVDYIRVHNVAAHAKFCHSAA